MLTIYIIGYVIALIGVLLAVANAMVTDETSLKGDALYFIVILPFLSWVIILLFIFYVILSHYKEM